jgi:hypothetical protein
MVEENSKNLPKTNYHVHNGIDSPELDISKDLSPKLGGDLDLNGNQITSPDGTDLIDIPDGSIDLQTNSTSRLDITDSGARLGGSGARVTTVLDEDDMSTDSATALATQQSVKAYVDSKSGSFGGDGSDGALDTSSSVVNIDLNSAIYVEKDYTSINIVTNNLTFSNPASEGTVIVLRSQGNVTISAGIVANELGGDGGTGGAGAVTGGAGGDGNDGTDGADSTQIFDNDAHYGAKGVKGETSGGGGSNVAGTGGAGGSLFVGATQYTNSTDKLYMRTTIIAPGTGGGGGGSGAVGDGSVNNTAGGDGGKGGGALYIECGGAWNFTGTINVAGGDGDDGTASASQGGSDAGGNGGGGGGAGGMVVVLYNSLTSNSGAVTVDGGDGGDGSSARDEAGANDAGGGGGGGGGGNSKTAGGDGGDGALGGGTAEAGGTPTGGGTGGSAGTSGSAGDGGGAGGGGGGAVGSSVIAQI